MFLVFPQFRNITPEIVEGEKAKVVDTSEDDLGGDIERKVQLIVLEQLRGPVGENKPDGNGGHDLVSQCQAEVQHLLLPHNTLLILRVKLLQSIVLRHFMSRH